ncbi:hypothetical protein MRX96_034185 [Rhipicephalus microplus]
MSHHSARWDTRPPSKHSLEHTFKEGLHGFDISTNDWYDPLMTIGALLGAAVSGSVSQALGRKSMLTVISLGFMSGWMVIYLSRGHIFHIYSGRFLTGFAMGLVSLVSPCYISEVTLPHNRGTMGGMLQMAITMGILYCYLLGRFLHLGLSRFGMHATSSTSLHCLHVLRGIASMAPAVG